MEKLSGHNTQLVNTCAPAALQPHRRCPCPRPPVKRNTQWKKFLTTSQKDRPISQHDFYPTCDRDELLKWREGQALHQLIFFHPKYGFFATFPTQQANFSKITAFATEHFFGKYYYQLLCFGYETIDFYSSKKTKARAGKGGMNGRRPPSPSLLGCVEKFPIGIRTGWGGPWPGSAGCGGWR